MFGILCQIHGVGVHSLLMTDQQLLNRYQHQHDADAFAEIVARHGQLVYATARRLVPADAEDIAQAVLLLLSQQAGPICSQPSLAGWLYQATRYCARNVVKMRRRREHHEREAATMQSEAQSVEGTDLRESLDDGLAAIGDSYRQVLLLRYLEGLSLEETAARLAISASAVAKRAERGLAKLRQVLPMRQRGITAAALGAAMVQSTSGQVPAALLAKMASVAGGSAGATISEIAAGGKVGFIVANVLTLAKVAAVIVVVAGAIGTAGLLESRSQSATAGQKSASPTASTMPTYSVTGVPRPGQYSLNGTITVRQALASAGADLAQSQAKEVDIQRSENQQSTQSMTIGVSELVGDRDLAIWPNDVVMLRDAKPADRRIAARDPLRVSIAELMRPNQVDIFNKVVDGQGRLHMPMVGAVQVAGLSLPEAQRAITKAYFEAKLIRDAENEVVWGQTRGQWIPLKPMRPGEWLLVRVWDVEAPNVETRLKLQISEQGKATLPMIGAVKIEGMEDYEAEQEVARSYKAANLIQSPTVAIERGVDGTAVPKDGHEVGAVAKHAETAFPVPTSPPVARPLPPEMAAKWQEFLQRWRGRPSAASIAVDYEIDERFIVPRKEPGALIHGYTQALRKISYAQSGDRFCQRCMSERSRSDGEIRKGEVTVAFDGKVGRSRDTDAPGRLFVAKSVVVPSRRQWTVFDAQQFTLAGQSGKNLPEALPDRFMPAADPTALEEPLARGLIEILDVSQAELDGRPAIRLEYRWCSLGTRAVAWYLIDQGYLQARQQWYGTDGNLMAEWGTGQVEMLAVGDGKSVFYPLTAYRQEYSEGKESARADMKVDRASLRVNQSLPDDLFVLQLADGERVLNVGLK